MLNPIKLKSLLKAVIDLAELDKTLDPLKLAEQLQNLSAGNLTFTTIPTHGSHTDDVGSVVVVHPADVKQFAMQLVAQPRAARQFGDEDGGAELGHGRRAQRRGHRRRGDPNAAACASSASRSARSIPRRRPATTVVKYPERHAGAGRDRRGARCRAQACSSPPRSAVTLVLGEDGRRSSRRPPDARGRRQASVVVLVRPDHGRAGGQGLHLLIMSSPEALFAAVLAARPAQPLVTFYDEARGERSELSARSLANWVAKTHFLLTDELGLGVGDAAFVDLPAHWISVPALLGCWTAGLEVMTDPARAAVAFVQPASAARAKGVPDASPSRPTRPAVGFVRLAARTVPPDYVAAVRPQPDAWATVHPPASPAIRPSTAHRAAKSWPRRVPGPANWASCRARGCSPPRIGAGPMTGPMRCSRRWPSPDRS